MTVDQELLTEVRYILRKWQRDEFPEKAAIEEITEAFTNHEWRGNPDPAPIMDHSAAKESAIPFMREVTS